MKGLLKSAPLLLLLLVFVACSDEDEGNPIVTADPVRTLIIGNVVLRPHVDFSAMVHPIYGQENELDSAFFGDTLCDMDRGMPYNLHGTNYLYGIAYYNIADSQQFGSGDTVPISLYDHPYMVEARVKLLELAADSVDLIGPPDDTTVAIGEPIELAWHPVENADWYGLGIWYSGSPPESDLSEQTNLSTTDTVFTIDGSNQTVDGDYTIYVIAVSGPVPGVDGPNINGTTMTGTIYSRSAITVVRVLVGSGQAKLVADNTAAAAIDRDAKARTMIEAIYRGK